MRKFYSLLVILFSITVVLCFPSSIWATDIDNVLNRWVTGLIDDIYRDQKPGRDSVQETALDTVSSEDENDTGVTKEFTITRTLNSIKDKLHGYLQYIVYIWLSAAVILLIWNGFQIITSSDKEKQMGVFKKNFTYILIWVLLLVAFYTIIDIFVGIVNLISRY